MKRSIQYLLFISLLCIGNRALFARHTLIDMMEKAVEQGDMVALKKFMRQFDREKMTPQERNAALAELVTSCKEVAHEQEDRSILNNKWDLARCIGGVAVALCGTYYLVKNFHRVWTVTEEMKECAHCGVSNCDGSHRCRSILCGQGLCNHLITIGTRQFFQTNQIGLYPGEKSSLYAKVVGSGGLTVLGLYHLYNGLSHAGQQETIEAAKGLEAYLTHTMNPAKT